MVCAGAVLAPNRLFVCRDGSLRWRSGSALNEFIHKDWRSKCPIERLAFWSTATA